MTPFSQELRNHAAIIRELAFGTDRPWPGYEPPPQNPDEAGIMWGKPVKADPEDPEWQSGATVTLAMCDVNGTAKAGGDKTVYLQPNESSIDLLWYDINGDGSSESANCFLLTTAICAFHKSRNFKYYMLGLCTARLSRFRIDGTAKKFQAKIIWRIGLADSTESEWMDIHAGTDCASPAP